MKKLAVVLMLVLGAPIALASTVEEKAKQSLEMWEPNEVRVDGESLTVISKERRITDQIYRAMIVSGLCMGTIPRPNSLDEVSEIRILNQFGRQGYVFEGGTEECEEINNMPANETEVYVLGRTHMHTNQ
ncbi:hypothetical protein [Chromohalobacter israelensis]|uniref:hypothetical protein n=1 Tax=Chromohalobacter israelensis TaxID=141390 RepID=UPI0015C4DCD6|nr:hypothetical protein [Chromohalobacter salexigens]